MTYNQIDFPFSSRLETENEDDYYEEEKEEE